MIVKKNDVEGFSFEKCHDGNGALICYDMLRGCKSEDFPFFHYDIIPPKVSIGEHTHESTEEIYYLIEGDCILIYDGKETEMKSGDFSLVTKGHSHGIINVGKEDAKLIVVASK